MARFRLLPEGDPPPCMDVFDGPTRVWHWTNAGLVLTLIVSGYFIGTPPPSTTGDASSVYVMGWIRYVHLVCGQLFAVGFLFRVYWAFMGNSTARALFIPAFWRKSWSDGIIFQSRWMVGLVDQAPRYAGVNPLSRVMMIFFFVIPAFVTIMTGFSMLAEVSGQDSWEYALFGWMVVLCGNTLDLHLYHRLSMWMLFFFFVLHLYIAVREDVYGRQTIVSTMLSGVRCFRK